MNSSAQIEVKAVVSLDAICFEPVVLSTIEDVSIYRVMGNIMLHFLLWSVTYRMADVICGI